VLRITSIHDSRGFTLKVEGKLSGPWTGELRNACAALTDQTPRPRLDLSALSFVDADGVELLGELRSAGFAVEACSGYVAAVLGIEKSS
jgi:hypothetical protein